MNALQVVADRGQCTPLLFPANGEPPVKVGAAGGDIVDRALAFRLCFAEQLARASDVLLDQTVKRLVERDLIACDPPEVGAVRSTSSIILAFPVVAAIASDVVPRRPRDR